MASEPHTSWLRFSLHELVCVAWLLGLVHTGWGCLTDAGKPAFMSCAKTSSPRASGGRPPQALTLSIGARFITRNPFLGKCQQSPRRFCECWAHLGYGPVPEPTSKKTLCHTHPVSVTINISSNSNSSQNLLSEIYTS